MMLVILAILLGFILMFVGFPFLIIGVMSLFGIEVGYLPALTTYLILMVASTLLNGSKG